MGDSFKGLEIIKKLFADISNVTISTVSDEPTSYAEGEFHIDRGAFEHELIALFDAYKPERDNGWREYGEDFDNDVFRVRYDREDGECTCGHVEAAEAWHAANPHKPECWDMRYSAAEDRIRTKWRPSYEAALNHRNLLGWGNSPEHDAAQAEVMRISDAERAEVDRWAKDNGWHRSDNWGIAIYCDCGVSEKAKEWFGEHDHKYPCDLWWMNQPNFLYKPTGYGIWWYKYPCRSAHGNQKMSVKEFRKIINACITSVES